MDNIALYVLKYFLSFLINICVIYAKLHWFGLRFRTFFLYVQNLAIDSWNFLGLFFSRQ